MKQSNSHWAVNLTALVLAAGLLIGLFTGCFQPGSYKPQTGNSQPQPNEYGHLKTDGYGTIIGYTCAQTDLPKVLVIPAKIGEVVITKIGWSAFKDCTSLTELKLPASLTEIGHSAFDGCTGLTNIDLSACRSLTEIGYNAFSGCTGLTSIDLSGCRSLTEIGYHAFSGCTGLTSIDLSGCTSLTEINGFSYCTSLTEVKLTASLTKICARAFLGSTALTEVKLPASLTEIGASAFSDCTGLTSAVFADKNGWKVYNNYNYSDIPTDIQLDNAATAAWYLREAYANKYWKKN